MGINLASLVVDLQLNSAALRSGIDSAKSALGSLGGAVDGIGKQLSALSSMKAFEIGKDLVTGLARFVNAGSQFVDKMGKMAQSAGTTTEAFSRFDYAAGLSGLSTEELGQAFSRLNANVAKAAVGGKEQVALFSALGIRVKDASGHVRESSALMSDLATKFAGMGDGASKSALAMEVFGKSGAAMIPFLNQGGDGLAKLADEADRFGITVSSSAAKAAEEFNDNLEKIHRISLAVGARVAGELAPAMKRLTDELLGSKDGASALSATVAGLSTVLKGLLTVGVGVGAIFDALGTAIGRTISALVDAMKGDFSAALNLQQGFTTDVVAAVGTAVDRIKSIWSDTGVEAAASKPFKAAEKSADAVLKKMAELKAGEPKGSSPGEWKQFQQSAPMVEADQGFIDKVKSYTDMMNAGMYAAAQERAEAEHSFVGVVKKNLSQIADAMVQASSILLSKMGDAGSVISSGIQGFMSGGPWGAVMAVIAELVSRLEVFGKFADKLNAKLFESLAELNDALGPLFEAFGAISEALRPLQAIVHAVIRIIINLITPIFEILGKVLGMIFDAISPLIGLFETIAEVVKVVLDAINSFSGPLDILGMVFFVVGKVINGIVLFILYIVKGIADIFGGNKGINDQVKKLEDSIKRGYGEKPAKVVDATTDKIDKMGTVVEKVSDKYSELLSNMPSGYKTAGARFNADNGGGTIGTGDPLMDISAAIAASGESWMTAMGDPTGGADIAAGLANFDVFGGNYGTGGGASSQDTYADVSGLEGGPNININFHGPVTVKADDPEEMYRKLKEQGEREQASTSRNSQRKK